MIEKSLFKKPNIQLEGLTPMDAAARKEKDSGASCPECKRKYISAELEKNLHVCPKCGHHMRISARQRIAFLTDAGSFEEMDKDLSSSNLLQFPEYDEKIASAMEKSGEKEAVVTGTCLVNGFPCALFVMDWRFMMGSMGTVVGEKITRLFEKATERKLPVVGFTVSGGARMQEGILSLMQMAKVSGAVGKHSKAGLFYLVILTDPTTGGVTASFAMEGDVILSEPNALIGFAGPRVIEQTTLKKLPEKFQRAELLLEKGFVDNIVDRRGVKEHVSMLLNLFERRPDNGTV